MNFSKGFRGHERRCVLYQELFLVLVIQDMVVKVGEVLGRYIAFQIRSLGRLGKQFRQCVDNRLQVCCALVFLMNKSIQGEAKNEVSETGTKYHEHPQLHSMLVR